jgi:prepilin-type processing-associated H-X9-DG protein
LSNIDSPGNLVWLCEKGSNDGNASWAFFDSFEWEWIAPTSPGVIGAGGVYNPSGDGSNGAVLYGDCDTPANASVAPTWTNFDDVAPGDCSSLPRFRHTQTSNVAFADGHVKAMHRGELKWYQNIYVNDAYNTAYGEPY